MRDAARDATSPMTTGPLERSRSCRRGGPRLRAKLRPRPLPSTPRRVGARRRWVACRVWGPRARRPSASLWRGSNRPPLRRIAPPLWPRPSSRSRSPRRSAGVRPAGLVGAGVRRDLRWQRYASQSRAARLGGRRRAVRLVRARGPARGYACRRLLGRRARSATAPRLARATRAVTTRRTPSTATAATTTRSPRCIHPSPSPSGGLALVRLACPPRYILSPPPHLVFSPS